MSGDRPADTDGVGRAAGIEEVATGGRLRLAEKGTALGGAVDEEERLAGNLPGGEQERIRCRHAVDRVQPLDQRVGQVGNERVRRANPAQDQVRLAGREEVVELSADP